MRSGTSVKLKFRVNPASRQLKTFFKMTGVVFALGLSILALVACGDRTTGGTAASGTNSAGSAAAATQTLDPGNPVAKAGLVYPGSGLVSNPQEMPGGKNASLKYKLSFNTPDDPKQIVAFYRAALAKWQDVEVDNQESELVFIDASKDSEQQQLSIMISPDLASEGQLIEIELEM